MGEKYVEGPDLIRETAEKVPLIQSRMRTAYSKQQSYADPKRRDIQFEEGDNVFLKISSMKGIQRLRRENWH